MYTVIGSASSRAFRVLWMLEELGAPYEHVAAKPRSETVVALNPSGKVPVLVEDGETISDSTAIIQYLADKHGRLTSSAGTLARARQDSMTHMLLDEIDACLWTAARHSFILPAEMRLSAIKDSLKWEFARSQQSVSVRLGDSPFLMGEAMTVPDIILTHCGHWARRAGFEITAPNLIDYLGRMMSRPGWQKVLAM